MINIRAFDSLFSLFAFLPLVRCVLRHICLRCPLCLALGCSLLDVQFLHHYPPVNNMACGRTRDASAECEYRMRSEYDDSSCIIAVKRSASIGVPRLMIGRSTPGFYSSSVASFRVAWIVFLLLSPILPPSLTSLSTSWVLTLETEFERGELQYSCVGRHLLS
jgi:hypothetical protein